LARRSGVLIGKMKDNEGVPIGASLERKVHGSKWTAPGNL
jgi:hypothetical protein